MKKDLIIVGSGSMARVVSYALPLLSAQDLRVVIASRSLLDAQEIATIANVRAQTCNSKVRFHPQQLIWDDNNNLEDIFIKDPAKVIFLTSSLQSPWELNDSTQWSNMVEKAGFGITLPLQSYLAVKLATLLKKHDYTGHLINACYPDAVNPLLKVLDLPITCGIGNISILYYFARLKLGLSQQDELKILAHHFHLSSHGQQLYEKYPGLVWVNGNLLTHNKSLFSEIKNARGAALNQITGCTAIEVIMAFINGTSIQCHVPGPYGLAGGYPVKIENYSIHVDLPPTCDLQTSILKNKEWSLLDGVSITDDRIVRFSEAGNDALRQNGFNYENGFYAHEINTIAMILSNLKENLRK